MTLDELRKRAEEIGERARRDPDFKQRLAENPKAVLAEAGFAEEEIDSMLEDPDVVAHGFTFYTLACWTSACLAQTVQCQTGVPNQC